MTTPGGVPNLPQGALTLDTLASTLQDMSTVAMKERAVARFPSIMDSSTGLSPAADLTPFGILTWIFSGFNSAVANADPADIQGPDDLPGLLLQFITELPELIIDQAAALLDMLGSYLGIPNLGDLLRLLPTLLTGATAIFQQIIDAIVNGLTGTTGTGNDPSAILWALLTAPLQIGGQLVENLFGMLASLQAQLNALQNNPGSLLNWDFTTATLSGWTNIIGALAITNGLIQTPTLSAGYPSTGPATDKHGAQIVIDGAMQGICRVAICSDTAASNYAALEVYSGFDGDAVRLVTGSSPAVSVIQQQFDLVDVRLSNLNAFDIWYEPALNRFHVERNGQPLMQPWVDSDNRVTHGSGKRRIVVVSNGLDRGEAGFRGPGIRKVTAYDK